MSKLQFFRGDTVAIPFTFPGLDLTGATVYFTIKPASAIDTDTTTDSAAIIKAQTNTHTDAVNGKTVINLAPSDTTVTPGAYKWDVQTKDAAGNIQTRVAAPQDVQILSDVTRRVS